MPYTPSLLAQGGFLGEGPYLNVLNGTDEQKRYADDCFQTAVSRWYALGEWAQVQVDVEFVTDPQTGAHNEYAYTTTMLPRTDEREGWRALVRIRTDFGVGWDTFTGDRQLYRDIFLHEMGHVWLAEVLRVGGQAAQQKLADAFGGTLLNWDAGPWENQIKEAVCESFKDAALEWWGWKWPNRTAWKLTPARWPQFTQVFFDDYHAYRHTIGTTARATSLGELNDDIINYNWIDPRVVPDSYDSANQYGDTFWQHHTAVINPVTGLLGMLGNLVGEPNSVADTGWWNYPLTLTWNLWSQWPNGRPATADAKMVVQVCRTDEIPEGVTGYNGVPQPYRNVPLVSQAEIGSLTLPPLAPGSPGPPTWQSPFGEQVLGWVFYIEAGVGVKKEEFPELPPVPYYGPMFFIERDGTFLPGAYELAVIRSPWMYPYPAAIGPGIITLGKGATGVVRRGRHSFVRVGGVAG